MNILFLASEAEPYVKVGGLADVAGSLPVELSRIDPSLSISLVLPYHPTMRETLTNSIPLGTVPILSGKKNLTAGFYYVEKEGIRTYLIDGEPIRNLPTVYSFDNRAETYKYVYFSAACVKLAEFLGSRVDILHCNDWHTALSAHILRNSSHLTPSLHETKTLITLHNLPFMGVGADQWFAEFGIQPSQEKGLPAWAKHVPLPMGLAAADRVIPVSKGYAEEILTPDYGCGLEAYLRTIANKTTGITNGLDTQLWDPQTDPFIPHHFTSEDLNAKSINKAALQKDLGVEVDPQIPLLIMISRLDQQKGVDLAYSALRKLSSAHFQAVLLGTGEKTLEESSRLLANDFPGKIISIHQFNASLSHRLYAAADILLMPSRYEPCGLSQMIAMRYGTIPVARSTGGLKDTIRAYGSSKNPTGFLFTEPNTDSLVAALATAFEVYRDAPRWRKMINTAMQQNFSWRDSATTYLTVYDELLRNNLPGIQVKP